MQINIDDVEVINNPAERRFEAQVGDYLAVIDYIPEEKLIIFTHTGVPDEIGQQGIASKMARTALEYVRDNDLKVVPQCPFVAGYIGQHPEYQSLVWDPKSQT
jgi:predicted GNAT family acetyltransferase